MRQAFTYLMTIVLHLASGSAFAQQGLTNPLIDPVKFDSLTEEDRELVTSMLKNHTMPLHDTLRLQLLVDLSENCDEQDILFFALPAENMANKILKQDALTAIPGLKTRILNKKALALNNIGILFWHRGNIPGGLQFLKLGLKIREQTGDRLGLAESLNNMGEMHRVQGDILVAQDYLNQSLKIREDLHDTGGIIISLNNISLIYIQQEDYPKAMENYQRGLKLAEAKKDSMGMGLITNNIAYLYQTLKDTMNVLEYNNRALALFRQVGYKQGISIVLNNLGNLYQRKKDPYKALECFNQSLEIWQKMGDVSSTALTMVNLGNTYLGMGQIEKAQDYGYQALQIGQQTGYPENIKRAALLLYNCYKDQEEYGPALKMHELYIQMRDSTLNEETKKSTFKQQMKFEYEKQKALSDLENQKALALAEEAKKRQELISYSIGAGLLLLILFSLFIFNRLKITQRQKNIIEAQKKIVEQKNKHITYSINYARRIQNSILPSPETMSESFPGHFIFFRPKDIVSGDFYWLSKQGDKIVLAVADCTGHGVPGAFMSMIGNTLLNEIVNEKKILQPAQILERLNEGVVHALHQESRSQADGMDISVCLFEHARNRLTFAGANHSLYLAAGGSLQKIEGDHIPIGNQFNRMSGSGSKTIGAFTQKEIVLGKNDTIFLTTDGYYDQKGGTQGGKFMSKRFRELLQEISGYSSAEQGKALQVKFEEWKSDRQQIDDVLVVGIKN